jgi:apolipoprotein N-acyltransferase
VAGPAPRLSRRLLVALVAGALLVLAFPPFDLWPLAVPAVAAFTWAAGSGTPRAGLLAGWLFGAAFFLALMPWLRVIGIDAWLGLSAFCALYLGVLGAATAVVLRLPAWPLWTAALWVTEEAVRSRVPFGGYPWGRLAFGQVGTSFTGWAAVGGAPLVTFAVALSGGLLAWAVVNRSRRRAAAWALLGSVTLPLTGFLVPTASGGEPVTVAVVQGNVPRTGLDAFGQREAVLRNHVAATYQLADDIAAGTVPQPDLVVWPENASDIDPFTDPEAYALIDGAVKAVGVPTLVGLVVATDDGRSLQNVGVVWDPETGPGERYVKRHLVPFGEYVPFRRQLASVVSRFDRVPRDFVPGDVPGVLQLGPATVADAICFEVAYDEVVRDAVRGGGQLVTVQTNNATYGRTGQVEQQLAISRLRAVEHGRTVLVAATSGISAVIAPDGTVLQRAPEFVQQVLVAEVPLRDGLNPATRVGAWPELLLVIVGSGAVVVGLRQRRRSGEEGT